jgi:hypothetical protein
MDTALHRRCSIRSGAFIVLLGSIAAAFAILVLLNGPVQAEWCTFAGKGITLDLPQVPDEFMYGVIDGNVILRVISGKLIRKPPIQFPELAADMWSKVAPPGKGTLSIQQAPNNGAYQCLEFIWDSLETPTVVRARIWIHDREFRIVVIKAPQDVSPDYWHRIVDSVKLSGGKIVMRGIE